MITNGRRAVCLELTASTTSEVTSLSTPPLYFAYIILFWNSMVDNIGVRLEPFRLR